MLGFLLIDKPEHMGSFDCVRWLRKILNVRRIGFVGTLDPLASGLMIFAIGEATKLIPYLEGLDKVYEVTATFGAVSDSYDADGKITELEVASAGVKRAVRPGRAGIEQVLSERFSGEVLQVPPVYSAIKVEGKRAYARARGGEKLKMKARKVFFHSICLASQRWPRARFTVHCGSGTYIRSFVHDLGQILGCGAYVEKLRRTKIGDYTVENAIAPDRINTKNAHKYIIAPQDFFLDKNVIVLSSEEYKTLANGGFISARKLKKISSSHTSGPLLAVYEKVCVGVLEPFKGQLKFHRKFL
ncbi:tRNA pseudouridine(55) synthase TruB [Patescibacteria group bacterium]|nr:tRNA pseudouridine(55) synthase TruB [Patescibacteria group bacterium]MBU1703273.1 tRNA pseudouridine(55) synthase TruB [Patescibacteria group bacterium]